MAYKRLRNLCVSKKFWKTVKPLFSNKIQSSSCITLFENNAVESNEGIVAEIMHDYFVNMTQTLGVSCANIEDSLNDLNENPCSRVIKYFESHSSILKIKGSINSTIKFSYRKATV